MGQLSIACPVAGFIVYYCYFEFNFIYLEQFLTHLED